MSCNTSSQSSAPVLVVERPNFDCEPIEIHLGFLLRYLKAKVELKDLEN